MATPEVSVPRQSAARTAMAGIIGNVLEWFDFGVYAYVATYIGKQFFPDSSPLAQQLSTFAVFAIGFIGRPIGGLMLGRLGDRIGRRALLTLSIAIMGVSTVGVGLLPTYATIGNAAPVLLVFLRMVQGFSLGGEFTGSMVYTTELASPVWRGLLSSSTAAGTTLGFLLGSLTVWLVEINLGEAATREWGWRIPFVSSVLLLIFGWLVRRGIRETEEGEKVAGTRPPILASLAADWVPMVRTFGIAGMTNAAYYLAFAYALNVRKSEVGADSSAFQLANTLSLIVVLFAKPFGGLLSDKIGRRRAMIGLTIVTMPLVYLGFHMMMTGSPNVFMAGQMLLGTLLGMALGLQGAMLVEIFPMRTRVMSMSFAYSVTLVLSGGIAPIVSTWLVGTSGAPLSPAYYVMAYGLIGLALMIPMKETNANRLDIIDSVEATPASDASRGATMK